MPSLSCRYYGLDPKLLPQGLRLAGPTDVGCKRTRLIGARIVSLAREAGCMAVEKNRHNEDCESVLHEEHLCYLMYQGFHYSNPEQYKELVREAEYFCMNCGRTARDEKNLCAPTKL